MRFITSFGSLIILAASVDAFNANPSAKAISTKTHKPGRSAVAVPLDIPTKPKVADTEEWVANLDYDAFTKEVTALGKELVKSTGDEDVKHLEKIVQWRNICALVGIGTMWLVPNPLTVVALSTWTYASWAMIAHHTMHGGFNRVDAGKFNSRGFALGTIKRRLDDWCDWMLPEAWNIEHNRLHHYHLGEDADPDLVQRNAGFLRDLKIPGPLKYGVVAALMVAWKPFYYAPNTFKELKIGQWKREGKELPKKMKPLDAVTIRTLLAPQNDAERAALEVVNPDEFFTTVMAPMFVSRFVMLPAPFLLIPGAGPALFGHALVNLMLADILTNIHGFITIVTNHAGEDVYAFDGEVKPRSGSFYVRQIVGSVNYEAGTDTVDFAHGWLNYQIEHHVWPDLSMLQYQKGAPRLKAICEKYGVPYVQESVWTRLRKTVDIMVGKTSMRVFPTHLEPEKDRAMNGVSWKSTNGAIDEE